MIAQLSMSSAKGGLELSTIKLAEDFAKAGATSIVICRTNSFIETASKEKHLTTFALNPKSKYFNFGASLRLRTFLVNSKVKAIYVHSLRDLWLLYPALAGIHDIQVIGFAHMFVRNVNKKDFLHQKIYSKLKYLVALTHLQKRELLKCLPVPEAKYVVIPNGVDIQKFSPAEKPTSILNSWHVKPQQKVIGYVGRLDPQKGVFEFLEAISLLKHRDDLKFVMIGDDTWPSKPTYNKMIERIAELNFGDRLVLAPFSDDVPELMRALDIFVMPSYEETFGLVLIEAMSTGLPCISTRAGGPPEILEDGEYGLLISPRAAAPITQAIEELLDNPELAKRYGDKARKKAVAHYDSHLIFNKIKSLID